MQNVANMSLFQRRLFIEQDIVNWTAIVPLPLPCISNWVILKQRSKRSLDSEASGSLGLRVKQVTIRWKQKAVIKPNNGRFCGNRGNV